MTTIETTTTKAAPAKNDAFTIQIPRAARRLAYQLETTPERIIRRAILIGIRSIDWNLGNEVGSPFADSTSTEEFDITKAMNRLSAARFSELCDGPDEPQKVLVGEDYERKYWITMEEREERDALIVKHLTGGTEA
jgi:hypothetical protein